MNTLSLISDVRREPTGDILIRTDDRPYVVKLYREYVDGVYGYKIVHGFPIYLDELPDLDKEAILFIKDLQERVIRRLPQEKLNNTDKLWVLK